MILKDCDFKRLKNYMHEHYGINLEKKNHWSKAA